MLYFFGALSRDLFIATGRGGLAVALVGFADDCRPLQVRTRLIVHVAAAVWALFWMGAPLLALVSVAPSVAGLSLVFGGACCGFLLWNWPPAKIFMGDVGIGFIGYIVGIVALAAAFLEARRHA